VKDGSKIKFWHDLWCGDQPLKATFSELFSIAQCKEAWVAYHMQVFNGVFCSGIYLLSDQCMIGR
jgi:hypothetical protein